jgi:4-hydroxy-2-oxoglutarate aldolase
MELRGVFSPVVTPFGDDGEVACDRLADNLDRWNRTDLNGYVVTGSTGECASLTEPEKLRLWEAARARIPPGKRLIAGTGCESTRDTIALTRQAASIGAEAALVVTPWYYKGAMKSRELVAHYQAVADASPIPILLYAFPQCTGVVLEPGAVATLAEHPNVIGMKDSSEVMTVFAEYIRVTPPSFQLIVGSALTFYPALCLGARAAILALANVAAEECALVYRLFLDGKHEEARERQLRLLPLGHAVGSRFGIAGVKAAMDLRGYYGGAPRRPLLPLGASEIGVVRDELLAADLI